MWRVQLADIIWKEDDYILNIPMAYVQFTQHVAHMLYY